jgi:FAD/FMN-containing dehydrogenase
MMRQSVLGLEVVLADGRVLDMLRALPKDNAGYDLKQIFIGSEGTLGLVTAVCVKLWAKPVQRLAIFAAVDSIERALQLYNAIHSMADSELVAFEYIAGDAFDLVHQHFPDTYNPFSHRHANYVLFELASAKWTPALSTMIREITPQLSQHAIELHHTAETEKFWQSRKRIPEAERKQGISIKHDIAVPLDRIPAFVEDAKAEIAKKFPKANCLVMGHLGDGNLHFNVAIPKMSGKKILELEPKINDIVYEQAIANNGTIAAEHGIGQMKKAAFAKYKNPLEIELMRDMKKMLDPKNILNPGKIFRP